MMLNTQPRLDDLHSLIGKIRDYPISAPEVANIARKQRADKNVIEFYDAFPDDAIFSNQEDLAARSEQVEMLNEEDQPPEILQAPEED